MPNSRDASGKDESEHAPDPFGQRMSVGFAGASESALTAGGLPKGGQFLLVLEFRRNAAGVFRNLTRKQLLEEARAASLPLRLRAMSPRRPTNEATHNDGDGVSASGVSVSVSVSGAGIGAGGGGHDESLLGTDVPLMARDVRKVDPLFAGRLEPVILVRCGSITVSLGRTELRAIILHDRCGPVNCATLGMGRLGRQRTALPGALLSSCTRARERTRKHAHAHAHAHQPVRRRRRAGSTSSCPTARTPSCRLCRRTSPPSSLAEAASTRVRESASCTHTRAHSRRGAVVDVPPRQRFLPRTHAHARACARSFALFCVNAHARPTQLFASVTPGVSTPVRDRHRLERTVAAVTSLGTLPTIAAFLREPS
eukprot:4811137-Pleurochrysis_carterae.AAC.1